jgi:hypothetical protein
MIAVTRRAVPRFAIGFLSLSLLQFGLLGCRPSESESPTEQLLGASKAANVQVHADEVFSISRGKQTFTAAPIVGWEQIPATALPNGVDIAYAYFATKEVPKGYYKLKAFANPTGVGTVDGKVQLIDQGGKVAAEIPAQVEIHSMTVPEGASSRRTNLMTFTDEKGQTIMWARCPNGQCTKIVIIKS